MKLAFLHAEALTRISLVLLFAVAFSYPLSGVAQEGAIEESGPNFVPEDVVAEGLTDCFDYYRFGSTPVTIGGELQEVTQGSSVSIQGRITNENPYPLFDATVYAKVFKQRGTEKDPNGPDVVDWLTIADSLTLQAGETMPLSFSWKVPRNAEVGEYQIATYVTSMDRFNMLGLTFTDDVTGGIHDFSVVGDEEGAVRFDKAGVTVNGNPFYFAAFPPRIPADVTEVPVIARIVNTSEESSVVTLSWKLYAWDALREDALISEGEDVVEIAPGGENEVEYVVTDTAHSVYYHDGALETENGSKSIIGVRFVRENIKEPRLNFVGASIYPPEEDAVAFACVHSTGTGAAENGKLELSIVRKSISAQIFGEETVSKVYEGIIPGEINALTMPLESKDTSFDVVARLYQNGELVDEVVVPYMCDELDAPCKSDDSKLITYGTFGALAFLIVAIVLMYRYGRRRSDTPEWGSEQPL